MLRHLKASPGHHHPAGKGRIEARQFTHYAAQSEAILSLLDRGADAHAKNNKGKRALDVANDSQISD